MRTLRLFLALVAFSTITIAIAQTAPPLPGRLVGAYKTSTGHRGNVVPVELTNIKTDGEKVTGVVSNYRTVSGSCVADNTPFTGTYRDGVLSIRSERMVTQKAEGTDCGRMVLNAKFSNGWFNGTFGLGKDSGIAIELEPK
jgi:hypothetical protein